VRLPLLLKEVHACRVCERSLPAGPRPLIQIHAKSRILIIGQAPGKAAHESGVPWNDRSGDRLREWLGITKDTFYAADRIALMPMGFCYPGTGGSGDMAPRPECAPLWHDTLLNAMKQVRLTVLIGNYALARYLAEEHGSITDAVRAHTLLLPARIALPHPSPRNNLWLAKNPWFAAEVLPALRVAVRTALRD
jgi:uracil-DNA glycosylase